jgi:hypothetical protein
MKVCGRRPRHLPYSIRYITIERSLSLRYRLALAFVTLFGD